MSGSSVPGLCTFREDEVHTNLMNALCTHTHSQIHGIYPQTEQMSASNLRATRTGKLTYKFKCDF